MTKRPVTIVTGFLGSGKTTLLARVLEHPSMTNTAVLVNEFGEVGLDHHLLHRADERTVLLGSGCVCCTTREDLAEALLELLYLEEQGTIEPLNQVVVETTGLADPAPILHTIVTDPTLQHHFYVDLVIATVDAVNGNLHLDRNPESVKQVAAADRIFVTKTDIAGESRPLVSRLRAINPSAHISNTPSGVLDPLDLFDRKPEGRPIPDIEPVATSLESHDTANTHSVSLTFDGPVDWTAFGIWFSMLLHTHGEDVLRVKGLLDVGGTGPVILNGVQHIIHPPLHLDEWPDEDHASRIVFITRGISSGDVLSSLEAFHGLIGARPRRINRASQPVAGSVARGPLA